MTDKETTPAQALRLRALPSVDALLRTETARGARDQIGARRLAHLARTVTEELRAEIQAQNLNVGPVNGDGSREALLAEAARRLGRVCGLEAQRSLRRVINASGVILHTNLGRAPLSEPARRAIADEAARYCTLEYDAQTGARGQRGARVEELLSELTGAEDALVVNNCAAAALLILTTMARTGETIVSRGELVEIGGDFRVPDVMAQSGTRMIEVGTTNRTRLSDYERALTDETRLIMRVHPSNYRIVGFTAAPSLHELALLAQDAGLPLYEDAGSGALLDLRPYGLAGEPVIAESIEAGADLVSFSGDKLLGAAQSGLIVGRAELVQQLRRHPLYRALRADKLALAALEATLGAYRRGAALTEVPTLRMLSLTNASLEERARGFLQRWRERTVSDSLRGEIIAGESAIGGGSAPTTHPATALIALDHETRSADALEEILRLSSPPVITRITGDRVLLDLRTVAEDEEAELLNALLALS
ncbi:MAG TPA: L-seryl-tRNA(Sec) selenium transferase [Pyrinomonadaceae bacterium]|jgi:L-seryl-tRNA(Ser) seleniumtransferase|nr:L-seryl-tRNA(Sec) selenium transferase [Pyrinomonadaceae bacterium]